MAIRRSDPILVQQQGQAPSILQPSRPSIDFRPPPAPRWTSLRAQALLLGGNARAGPGRARLAPIPTQQLDVARLQRSLSGQKAVPGQMSVDVGPRRPTQTGAFHVCSIEDRVARRTADRRRHLRHDASDLRHHAVVATRWMTCCSTDYSSAGTRLVAVPEDPGRRDSMAYRFAAERDQGRTPCLSGAAYECSRGHRVRH